MIRTINALLHAVGLDASLIGTLLLSLSTIAGTEISNPSWVNFQSAGWVSFQSAPTEWGDFKHIMDALFDFKKEGASTAPGALSKHKELIYNPKYFEELNVVTFLVCDEIENFSQKTDHQLKDMLFTRNVDIEHLGFNLILSVKDGLILHCGFSGGHQIATPYPKLRNTKSTIFVKTPINSDNSHIVTFVSMLLHAISSTAVFEFSPVPYIEQLMHDLEKDPSMRRIIE